VSDSVHPRLTSPVSITDRGVFQYTVFKLCFKLFSPSGMLWSVPLAFGAGGHSNRSSPQCRVNSEANNSAYCSALASSRPPVPVCNACLAPGVPRLRHVWPRYPYSAASPVFCSPATTRLRISLICSTVNDGFLPHVDTCLLLPVPCLHLCLSRAYPAASSVRSSPPFTRPV
jgi:hypothetical protein